MIEEPEEVDNHGRDVEVNHSGIPGVTNDVCNHKFNTYFKEGFLIAAKPVPPMAGAYQAAA